MALSLWPETRSQRTDSGTNLRTNEKGIRNKDIDLLTDERASEWPFAMTRLHISPIQVHELTELVRTTELSRTKPSRMQMYTVKPEVVQIMKGNIAHRALKIIDTTTCSGLSFTDIQYRWFTNANDGSRACGICPFASLRSKSVHFHLHRSRARQLWNDLAYWLSGSPTH